MIYQFCFWVFYISIKYPCVDDSFIHSFIEFINENYDSDKNHNIK